MAHTWRAPDFCFCCHSKTVFGRTRRCIRNCITFTARACYFLLLWRAVSLLFSIFSTTYSYFGALATQSIFSDKDHRLRQPPSRVRCVLFCLQPPPTKALGCCWLSSSWSTFGVYVGLIDEADLRAVSERPSGTTCCHPSSVVSSCATLSVSLSIVWSKFTLSPRRITVVAANKSSEILERPCSWVVNVVLATWGITKAWKSLLQACNISPMFTTRVPSDGFISIHSPSFDLT
ncbi:hypothetical protein HKD37_09G024886 [Glycine soja]